MELRVLRYFLVVAREKNITKAAELLHISQPTLSRQLMQLEEALGTTLYHRGNRNISLTEAGMLLKRRAEEVVQLIDVMENELKESEHVSGAISIGSGDVLAFDWLAQKIKQFRDIYPDVIFHFHTGNADQIKERMDSGLCDIGVLIEPVNINKYDFLKFDTPERWGILVRKEDPLADNSYITPKEIMNLPILISRRSIVQDEISKWLGEDFEKVKVVGTFNVINSAIVLVRHGIGYPIMNEGIDTSHKSEDICFIPFQPVFTTKSILVWKKHQVHNMAVTKFISFLEML